MEKSRVTCKRCFHAIGEHYLCRDHGGEPGFSAMVGKWKPPAKEPFPGEAEGNWQHGYWTFLDKGEPMNTKAQGVLFSELIP